MEHIFLLPSCNLEASCTEWSNDGTSAVLKGTLD